ncbi:hypothetical protein ACC705_34775, partial [Rhizobium ruizarguesonis]
HRPAPSHSVQGTSPEAARHSTSVKADETKEKNLSAQLAGLNSLKRNYKALMHTADPRMTAIAAEAVAYAQYELDNGIEPAAEDPM